MTAEEKQRLKEYQKNYREAKKTIIDIFTVSFNIDIKVIKWLIDPLHDFLHYYMSACFNLVLRFLIILFSHNKNIIYSNLQNGMDKSLIVHNLIHTIRLLLTT